MSPLLRRGASAPLRVGVRTDLLEVLRSGPAPLAENRAGVSLRIAFVVPQFRRGSGGHATIANLVRGLEARGHACSLWVLDEEGRHDGQDVARLFGDFFGPVAAPVRMGFEDWAGADV